MGKHRDVELLAAILLPVVFLFHLGFALAGHPSSLWLMQMLGVLP